MKTTPSEIALRFAVIVALVAVPLSLTAQSQIVKQRAKETREKVENRNAPAKPAATTNATNKAQPAKSAPAANSAPKAPQSTRTPAQKKSPPAQPQPGQR